LRSLLLTAAQWRDIQLRVLVSAGLSADPFTSAAEAMSWADAAAPYDLFILDESVEASPEQIRQIVRLCSLGKDLRTLRLRRPGAPERPGWDLPGRAVELEWPLTPARVRRAIESLYAASPPDHDPPGQAWAARGPAERGASVLLVEDNPDSQAYALRVLNGAGHSVDVASTGEQAVRLAGSQRYEVILMDVMLPDMTGFEATRQIRVLEKQSGHSAVPVVALTAHALLEYRREAFSSEMNDYVTKPVRPSALLNAVRQWAGQGSQERATPQGEVLVAPDVADLVPGYLERARRQLDEIQSHARAGAAGPAARLAHNLKGTGQSYGFAMVTEAGARMEEAARAGDCDSVAREAAELSRLLEKVRWRAAPP
jgi:CheY-like chemotaxis protein